jgi:hypothetical protein
MGREWAHEIAVALRITGAQMSTTAAELISPGARFAECVPFFSIPRLLLGSAVPTDGRMPVDRYLRGVRAEAADAPLVYLPHRRETESVLTRVRATAGLPIFDSGLSVELLLDGAQEPLELITPPASYVLTDDQERRIGSFTTLERAIEGPYDFV